MSELADLIAEFQRVTDEEEFYRQMQEQQELQRQVMLNRRSQPRQQSGMPSGMGSLTDMLSGAGGGGMYEAPGGAGGIGGVGTSEGGVGGAGGSGAGIAGYVAAAILGQHLLSRNTDTEFEGVKSDDVFGGHFATEPWFAWASDRLGNDPTAGERFDAAIENKDYGKALKRLPGVVDYWANPINSWIASGAEAVGGKKFGKTASGVLNPIGWLAKKLG